MNVLSSSANHDDDALEELAEDECEIDNILDMIFEEEDVYDLE